MNDIVDDSYQWSEPRDSRAPDLKPYADLAKALAEVERQNVENLKLIDEEHERDLAEKDTAYQQLMEKTVRFAEHCIRMIPYNRAEHAEAIAFLKEHKP